jgi:N-methylhydantoinase B
MKDAFDPVAMEIFSNRLLSITEEMGHTLVRSSFSTNIKERRDCSVGLFDGRGRLVCQASHVPLHLGSLMGGVEATLARFPVETMKPGDAFVMNDAYLAGGTHSPDITIVTPVFWDGRVRFFCANIGHHSDLGGPQPGSVTAGAQTVFEEGLRIPALQVARAGEIDEHLLDFIAQNTREPEERVLDLRVQIATNRRGEEALHGLIRQMGIDGVECAIRDVLAYTRRRLERRIAELKDGRYGYTAWLDDDGMGDGGPVAIRCTLEVGGEKLRVDFAGSAKQARGAMNVAKSALHATVYYAIKTMLDPELPPNSGMFEAIEIAAPEGTIVNPSFPGAVGARSITCQRVAGAVLGAFSDLVPRERVMAAGNDLVPAIVFGGKRPRSGRSFVYLETVGGGAGARADGDGMDAVHVHMTNTSNLPAESLEHEYPLLVDAYALVDGSGGAGRHRGGLGIARQVRALQDGVIFNARSDNHVHAPKGVFGGADGKPARLVFNPGQANERELPSKVSRVVLKRGDAVRLETPGGGGYGPPAQRALDDLAEDLRDGVLTREQAERAYGADLVARALATTPSRSQPPPRSA